MLTCKIFTNPITETEANRDGIVYVTSRMKWYDELSNILVRDSTVDEKMSAGLQAALEQRITELYRTLLLYLIKSVCSCHRNRFHAFFRDTLKLDDWKDSLQNVENAEKAVLEDSKIYTSQQMSHYLEGLLDEAQNRQEKLLGNIRGILQEEISLKLEGKDNECIQEVRVTDPRDDKKRIEDTKGGLLKRSYQWILHNPEFQNWRDYQQSRVLWIQGDPGKGKTMLVCGIVNELKSTLPRADLLSYFFCQASNSQLNNATVVLRGLVYLLVEQQPSLCSHLRKRYDHAGRALFADENAWFVLSEILTDILQDLSSTSTFLVIDALDECVTDLPKLVKLVIDISTACPHVKWVLSSRKDLKHGPELQRAATNLVLEQNPEQISQAVNLYIDHRLSELTQIQHDKDLQDLIREKMQHKAHGTFLWVSFVTMELKDALAIEVLEILDDVPIDLKDMYRRMMEKMKQLPRRRPKYCQQVLSTVLAAYRPLHLQELHVLSDLSAQDSDVGRLTTDIVNMCGSFLSLQDGYVYIVHESARNFLMEEASRVIFPSGVGAVHDIIFSRSLQVMSVTLRQDIYGLQKPGIAIEDIQKPNPDPLAISLYSCAYWIDHLCSWHSESSIHTDDLKDGGAVDRFVREKYLYWLEALSLCKIMGNGVLQMAKLENLIPVSL